jgi:hypothetical protein
MTLEQKIEALTAREESLGGQRFKYVKLCEVIDTINAHIAGMGEPVGFVKHYAQPHPDMGVIIRAELTQKVKDGALLYTAPPIDIAAIREVIAALQSVGNDHHGAWADKLTRAIYQRTKMIHKKLRPKGITP